MIPAFFDLFANELRFFLDGKIVVIPRKKIRWFAHTEVHGVLCWPETYVKEFV